MGPDDGRDEQLRLAAADLMQQRLQASNADKAGTMETVAPAVGGAIGSIFGPVGSMIGQGVGTIVGKGVGMVMDPQRRGQGSVAGTLATQASGAGSQLEILRKMRSGQGADSAQVMAAQQQPSGGSIYE